MRPKEIGKGSAGAKAPSGSGEGGRAGDEASFLAIKRDMANEEADEMYENIDCPRCKVSRSFHCEDLRRRGASQHTRPHRERIQAYRTWKKAQTGSVE